MAHWYIDHEETAPFEGWDQREVTAFARYVGERVGFYLADLSATKYGIDPYIPAPDDEAGEWDDIWTFSYFQSVRCMAPAEVQEWYDHLDYSKVTPLFIWEDRYSGLTQLIFEFEGTIYSSEDTPVGASVPSYDPS